MDNNWLIAAVVGAALLIIGLAMLRSHQTTWRLQKADPELDGDDRAHYYRRYRRRMQTSGAIAALGILIPLGDALVWQLGPRASTFYWVAILGLVMWIIILALGDLTSTTSHSRVALARVHRKQRELEAQAAELQRRHAEYDANNETH